ncbi:FHA domain-containing protein [Exilibacterium tricleocarpae]|uniref:FHA domain-containing protein n=1 Tax=Exilibacterium tricleocarpae TaxID=2591008 RepID=UPI0015D1F16F|nr:FHA domain-containing protein [Exilibacterium tricleocarpae]
MTANDLTRVNPASTSLALRSLATGETFALEGEMLVGREVECAIILSSRQISRYHAKILVAANKVFIEDLHSSNGTFVNGKQIASRTLLTLGDEVAFDELAYRVTSRQSGAAAATVVATPKMKQAAADRGRAADGERPAQSPAAGSVAPPVTPAAGVVPMAAEPVSVAVTPDPGAAAANARANSTKMLTPDRREQIESVNRQFQRDVSVGSGPRLVVMTAPMRGQVFTLDNNVKGKEWLIGRDKDADIHIQEKSVSRDHARLIRLDSSYRILATRAANGVVVNGETKSASGLRHNDRIQIGRITLVFKTDEPQLEQNPEETQIAARSRGLRIGIIAAFVGLLLVILALIIAD